MALGKIFNRVSLHPTCSRRYANDVHLLIVRRVEALGKFLDTEDGKNLLAGYKRATNIIRIEEKRDGRSYGGSRTWLSIVRTRNGLLRAIDTAKVEASAAVAKEDFAAAMRAMAKLRPHVDAFFDKVTVNVADGADKEKLRENRLKLLNEIREATRRSRISRGSKAPDDVTCRLGRCPNTITSARSRSRNLRSRQVGSRRCPRSVPTSRIVGSRRLAHPDEECP